VGHARDRALGARVVRLAEVAEVRRGDRVHDRAARALLAHAQRGLLRAHEGPVDVDAQHVAELLVAHLEEGTVADVAGVVHDRVDRAELVDAALHERSGAGARADVRGVRAGLAAEGSELRGDGARLVRVDVVHDHGGALTREVQAVAAADAAPAAGDDRRPAVEDAHPWPPPAPGRYFDTKRIENPRAGQARGRARRPGRRRGPAAPAEALGDAVGVLVDGPEEVLAGPGALQVVVGGDLPGVAHAAVDLDAGARVLQRGVPSDDLRRRDRERDVADERVVEGRAGRVDRGARGLLAHEDVGEHVLQRLEGADRPPDLLAPLGVVGRELGRRLGDPEQLRRDKRRALEAQLPRRAPVADALALRQRLEQVQRRVRVERQPGGLRRDALRIGELDAVG